MISANGYSVFFDFDNTVTTCDVIDDMVLRFSKDKQWVELEEKWQKGKIGSKECLQGQISGVRITKKEFDNYLSQIKLDPYFKKIINFLKSENIKPIILSDNFDYSIRRILANSGIRNLKVYSNNVVFVKGRLKTSFPFSDKKCRVCAHCKKNNLLANVKRGTTAIYIGDGLSDVCPAQYADIVFAKGNLLRFFRNKRLPCVAYGSLKDVYGYLRRSLGNGKKTKTKRQ